MEKLNELFNSFIDISQIVVTRLSELPYPFVVVALTLGVTLVFGLRALRQRRSGRREALGRRYLRALGVTLAAGMLLYMFQRLDLLLREVQELQYYVRIAAVHQMGAAAQGKTAAAAIRLFDPAALERGLEEIFEESAVETETLGEGIEFASVRSFGSRPIAAYATVIDLTNPRFRIAITESLGDKRLTSRFARDHDCIVAINGEAGSTPARTAPLGGWVGNWVVEGKAVMLKDTDRRPFMSFDRNNKATYVRAEIVDTEMGAEDYNVLWGRKDLLVDGEYYPDSGPRWTPPAPRTLMGIDAAGTRLVLMVIDGRQPGYSVGLDLETSAKLIRLFGVRNAMWCDQGGSSTMYLAGLSAPVNRPSDGHERATYSHFGIALQ